eukprot:768626-Hanusia_phi.AAC.4
MLAGVCCSARIRATCSEQNNAIRGMECSISRRSAWRTMRTFKSIVSRKPKDHCTTVVSLERFEEDCMQVWLLLAVFTSSQGELLVCSTEPRTGLRDIEESNAALFTSLFCKDHH